MKRLNCDDYLWDDKLMALDYCSKLLPIQSCTVKLVN